MNTSKASAKIGTILYVIWACLHFMAARSVYMLGRSLDPSMIQGRIFQDAFNLLFFSIIAIVIAVTLNWRNNVWGYWINLVTVGVADVGFILFVIVPGHMPVWPGILGPVFWVLATIFSTIAILTADKGATKSQLRSSSTPNERRA
ncbi:putative membrane protein [Burkholderia cenocepacia]|uniref:Membrane protein n=1 Tax=Burkholderia cenocepacia TaxID=95486 RepID=A0AAN0RVE7_9BURK|nr:putative membrane protein [Burkholderia cenocepacia]